MTVPIPAAFTQEEGNAAVTLVWLGVSIVALSIFFFIGATLMRVRKIFILVWFMHACPNLYAFLNLTASNNITKGATIGVETRMLCY